MKHDSYVITALSLTDFRNYQSQRLETSAMLVALAGPNGAGKTNLIEAISMLSPGRGLRGDSNDKLARFGSTSGWGVAAALQAPYGAVSIGTGMQASEAGDSPDDPFIRRSIVDGRISPGTSALAGILPMLWLTPAMDRLFAGSPGERRRFFDRLAGLFDPEHQLRVNRLERLIRERSQLLAETGSDHIWIASVESQMAETAVAIAASRKTAIGIIDERFSDSRGDLLFPWGQVRAGGELENMLSDIPALQVEAAYRTVLAQARDIDRAAGRCLRGPHRSDIHVFHGPKSMPAALCSTGEQKALLLGLILAQAEAAKTALGAAPVLLLDEVTAHLDATRRQGLYSRLNALESQVWMTGTDTQFFDGAGDRSVVYRVEHGHIFES